MNKLSLENEFIQLNFERELGTISHILNKFTGEMFTVTGDLFEVETVAIHFQQDQCEWIKLAWDNQHLETRFKFASLHIQVDYHLDPARAFVEKQVSLTNESPYGLRRVVISHPTITAPGLTWLCYAHPDFDLLEAQVAADFNLTGRLRPEGLEPCKTFFGRTSRGGLMAGVELAFAEASLEGERLSLAIRPNLKVKAGEKLVLEPIYLGVYQRSGRDRRAAEWQPNRHFFIHHGEFPAVSTANLPGATPGNDMPPSSGKIQAVTTPDPGHCDILPLPSESQAMVALTSAILGPRRHRLLAAMACGWHSEMTQWQFTQETATLDKNAQNFLVECGLEWLTDSHPWAGEVEKLSQLGEGEVYAMSPLVQDVLEHARQLGLRVVQWPTMNQVHPWLNETRTLLQEKSDWLRVLAPAWQAVTFEKLYDCWPDRFKAVRSHCLANTPFWEWITRLNLQVLESGLYAGWVMDGDFWGTGGYFQTTVPVECYSDQHDHLPGDANYACQKALERWVECILEKHPQLFIAMCRPVMDLGVWALRNVDACFTLVETGTSKSNLAGGNEIRLASRIRTHQHFFPHYLDWCLLFPSYANPNDPPRPWSSEKLDYILLSALSCSPNLLLYLPARSGIPGQDKAEIRKWLDWGRKHLDFLLVRRDLFDWTSPGKVDGSVHWVGNEGITFLFNPNPQAMNGEIELTEEAIGQDLAGDVVIWQEYPQREVRRTARWGETVQWEVPEESVVVLRVKSG